MNIPSRIYFLPEFIRGLKIFEISANFKTQFVETWNCWQTLYISDSKMYGRIFSKCCSCNDIRRRKKILGSVHRAGHWHPCCLF